MDYLCSFFIKYFFFTCNGNKQLLDSKETQFDKVLIELWDYVHRDILLGRLLFLRSVQEAVDEITMLSMEIRDADEVFYTATPTENKDNARY